jgi:hypothetical protein
LLLSYFRINDPYRLLSILVLLVLIRLPFLISDTFLTVPELKWMLIGEKLSSNADLYADVWDHTGPLSAAVYFIIDVLFGRSLLAFHILALLLVVFQAGFLNLTLIANKSYKETTFIPSLVYILLMSLFFDQMTLSPVLMSMTFIVLVIHHLALHLENKSNDETILKAGLTIGIASLFYLPAILFLIPLVVAFAIFTATSLRKYFLLLYGVMLPFLLAAVWFYWHDAIGEFYLNYFLSFFLIPSTDYLNLAGYAVIAMVPLIFFVLSVFKIIQFPQFSNIQNRFQASVFFFIAIAFLIWFVSRERSSFQFTVFVPFFAFYITHFFLLIRRHIYAEISFALFLIFILLVNLGSYYEFFFTHKFIEKERLVVESTPYDHLVEGKNIFYIGKNLDVYQHARLATPYLNWHLSRLELTQPGYYDNITSIYENFMNDLPEIIIDKEGVMPGIFDRAPALDGKYVAGEQPYIYFLR